MVGINYDFGTKNENFGAVGERPAFHSEYDNADKPTFGQLFFRASWDVGLMVVVDHKGVEIITATLTIVNAVLHGLAWNMLFPTEVERQLYHAACISIAVTPLIVLILVYNNNLEWGVVNTAYKLSKKGELSRFFKIFMTFGRHSVDNREHHKGLMKPEWIGAVGRWIIFAATAFLALLYFVAMTIISLEPWLSVRKLEKGSYDTVEWAEMLPHL